MASNTKLPPPPSASNGVITGPPKGVVGGNRKKQKRRAKQAARSSSNSHPPPLPSGAQAGLDYDEDPLGYGDEDDFDYSDADQPYDQYLSPHGSTNGYSMAPPPPGNNKKKKKKKSSSLQHDYNPELLGNNMPPLPNPPPPPASYQHPAHKPGRDQIWNTSTQQERQNIKEFWLSLSEEERKSLLKIEKEAVLRKMKQQQKHSCSCTVCGRKRTAIEEELEVLYEGYYEELEQYAHHDQPPLPSTDGMIPDPLQHRQHPFATPPPNPHHRTSQLQEHFDEDEYSDEEEEIDYSDEEYSDDEIEHVPRNSVPDLFSFGQNLTVKGILTPWLEKLREDSKLNDGVNIDNLLTVADDLLKNDGRKFIEMMEQLAERRMQRESEAEYAAANPSHPGPYPPGDAPYGHDDPLGGDEFDDDEESYGSGEEYDEDMDDEDDMGGLTEEQRMQEGRRMFQIFAARMFEQRVLTAYKEKVAAERQQKLLEELEDESKQEAQREAKKQRDAQKKKDKKKQAQQAKAEEKAKKEAEKAAEDARLKEAEEKKLEEQRRKKEEQRKKKEDEKRKQDEERAKKEAEKVRRQQEEQQRREEAERKVREAKAAEKAKKEEAKRREREEREAREKDVRERKAQEEKDKKEREEKLRADREARERDRSTQGSAPSSTQQVPQIQKRPSQPGLVAVPGVYPKQTTSGVSSPHPSVAIPAVPKAPTPAKPRQASQQGSLASSPKQSHSQVSSAPSKSSSPSSAAAQQPHHQPPLPTIPPKTVLQKPGAQQSIPHVTQQGLPTTNHLIQPPPGMPYPQPNHPPGFGAMPPMGFHSFQGAPGPMMHNMGQRGHGPIYQQQGLQMSNRFGAPGMNGPPPGMIPPQGRGAPFPFDGATATQPPPGFPQQQQMPPQSNQHTPPIGAPAISSLSSSADASRTIIPSHSRQQSASDKERFESAANQPIARPAPIQRPSSVKPHGHGRGGSNSDIEDLSAHLGSSALIGDDDEPMPSSLADNRRSSNIPVPARGNPINPIGGGFGAASTGFGAPGWNPPGLPFGQSSGLGQQNWGGLASPSIGSWSNNNNAFASNSAFGAIGGGHVRPGGTGVNRPLMIRLAVCQACKQLDMSSRGEIDGYHSVDNLLHQIAGNRTTLDPPPTLHEISEICETEGDSQNGGGELARKDGPSADKFSVKWTPDAGTPDTQGRGLAGLGEIGSPMPHKASPASSFGVAPGMGRGGTFPNLGSLGSTSGFQ